MKLIRGSYRSTYTLRSIYRQVVKERDLNYHYLVLSVSQLEGGGTGVGL
jgi:hypothetical protein